MAREQSSTLSYSYNGHVLQYDQELVCRLQEEDVLTATAQDLVLWALILTMQ